MNWYKLFTLVMISVLISILLGSILNNRSGPSARSEGAQTAWAANSSTEASLHGRSIDPAVPRAGPGPLYLPLILMNIPVGIGCITTTNGIGGAEGGVCNGNVTVQLVAGGQINNDLHTFGLQVNNSGGGPGTAALYGRQGGGSGITAGGPAGIWGDSSANYGVIGTSSSFPGVLGLSTDNDALRGFSTNGNGVHGRQGTGSGLSPSTAVGVWGDSSVSGGVGIYGSNANGAGVFGDTTSGSGVRGFAGSPTGTNYGVYGQSNSTSGTGVYGVNDQTSGPAFGVVGSSSSPGGAGVRAIYSGAGTGPGLELAQGGFKITGAGVGTSTAAFVHQVVLSGANANTCAGNNATILNNPYANNNPNALLFVTFTANGFFRVYGPNGYGVLYNSSASSGCPADRWLIYFLDLNTTWQNGVVYNFNVLVINP